MSLPADTHELFTLEVLLVLRAVTVSVALLLEPEHIFVHVYCLSMYSTCISHCTY